MSASPSSTARSVVPARLCGSPGLPETCAAPMPMAIAAISNAVAPRRRP